MKTHVYPRLLSTCKSLPALCLLSIALNLGLSNPALAQRIPEPTLRQGSTSSDVELLQRRLAQVSRAYFNGPFTGYYGELTEAAVRRFQQDQGLLVDGIYGPNTRNALQRALRFGADTDPSSPGISARYVVAVPVRDGRTLSQVQQFVYDAIVVSDRLGNYVQAGSFSNRSLAESQVRKLRGEKLDARVIYRR